MSLLEDSETLRDFCGGLLPERAIDSHFLGQINAKQNKQTNKPPPKKQTQP